MSLAVLTIETMPKMPHTFRIVFQMQDESLESHLEALQVAGCHDAAFAGSASDGSFTAEFDRLSRTFSSAVISALESIQAALPGVRILRVLPDDLVTIAAIADRTNRTDESVRLLILGRRGPGGFPSPAGHINEKTQIWRWFEVVRWLANYLGESPAQAEHAQFLAALNDALELRLLAVDLRKRPDEWKAVESVIRDGLLAA